MATEPTAGQVAAEMARLQQLGISALADPHLGGADAKGAAYDLARAEAHAAAHHPELVTKVPEISAAEVATARKDWQRTFDSHADFHGIDSRDRPAELIKWMAKFDAASGYEAPTAEAMAAADHAEQHFVNPSATAADYKNTEYDWKFARSLPDGRLAEVHAEVSQWGAQMHFPPELGRAILARISEIGPRLQTMSEGDKLAWLAEQRAAALGVAPALMNEMSLEQKQTWLHKFRNMTSGDQDQAYDALLMQAKDALNLAGENAFGKSLATSDALRDATLMLMIIRHSANHARWKAAKPG